MMLSPTTLLDPHTQSSGNNIGEDKVKRLMQITSLAVWPALGGEE